ncbi:MAG TPA: hypothetical protein VGN16_03980 [Acidobacteriaceae bacterium]|jgi:hypothetical protein
MSDNKKAIEWLREHARRCEQAAIDLRGSSTSTKEYESTLANYFADQIEALEKPWAQLTSAPGRKLTGVKIVPPTPAQRKAAMRMKRSAKA